MKRTLWNKRFPTLFGILLIVIGTVATTYLVQTGVIVIGRASPADNPQDIRITNVTDTSFIVSYTTKDPAFGAVSFGSDRNTQSTILDDRDQSTGKVSAYTVHYITVKELLPNTEYYFTITSNKSVFLNNGDPFEVVTGPQLTETKMNRNVLAGTITFLSDDQSKEAIVYLTSKNMQAISTLVKPDGSYTLPLNIARNKDLASYTTFSKDETATMLIVGSVQKSYATLSLQEANTIPPITLANNYDFTLSTTPIASTSSQFIGFPSFSSNSILSKDPTIITPKEDEGFVDSQPLFKGTASPGAKVKVIIHSEDVIEVEITADAYGNWLYRPTQTLSTGQHTISVIARDNSGILKAITKPFTVYASGTQIENATPSASPIPSIPTTPTILSTTPSPTVPPTLTPTAMPTSTPAVLPTSTPEPTALPTQITPLPPPGSSTTQTITIAAIFTIFIGVLTLLFARRGTSSL